MDELTHFIYVFEHELRGIFTEISCASDVARHGGNLLRKLDDIRDTARYGYHIVKMIRLLFCPDSDDYHLRSHRLRDVTYMIRKFSARYSANCDVNLKLSTNLMVKADLSLLHGAVHQMFAIAFESSRSSPQELGVRLIGDTDLQIRVEWNQSDDGMISSIRQQLLQKITKMHGGKFELQIGPQSLLTITLPVN